MIKPHNQKQNSHIIIGQKSNVRTRNSCGMHAFVWLFETPVADDTSDSIKNLLQQNRGSAINDAANSYTLQHNKKL